MLNTAGWAFVAILLFLLGMIVGYSQGEKDFCADQKPTEDEVHRFHCKNQYQRLTAKPDGLTCVCYR